MDHLKAHEGPYSSSYKKIKKEKENRNRGLTEYLS
jgi:hypothetical protein